MSGVNPYPRPNRRNGPYVVLYAQDVLDEPNGAKFTRLLQQFCDDPLIKDWMTERARLLYEQGDRSPQVAAFAALPDKE